MKKFITSRILPILLLVSSCHHPLGNQAVIQGDLADTSGLKLTLQEMDTREIHSIDSVVPDHSGKFNFSPVMNEPGFWLVKAPNGKILVLLLNPATRSD